MGRIWTALLVLLALAAPAQARQGAHLVLRATAAPDERLVEIVRGRLGDIDGAVVTRKGARIVVDMPGYTDLARLRTLFGPPPVLTLRLVDEAGVGGRGTEMLPRHGRKERIAVFRAVVLRGTDIADARSTFYKPTGEPVISIDLTARGRERFAKVTAENVGRRLAIVLDGTVLSAPWLREPITGGKLLIQGSLTAQEAHDLARSLTSGGEGPSVRIVELRLIEMP